MISLAELFRQLNLSLNKVIIFVIGYSIDISSETSIFSHIYINCSFLMIISILNPRLL